MPEITEALDAVSRMALLTPLLAASLLLIGVSWLTVRGVLFVQGKTRDNQKPLDLTDSLIDALHEIQHLQSAVARAEFKVIQLEAKLEDVEVDDTKAASEI